MPSAAEASGAQPHTLFVKTGCRYCDMIRSEIQDADMESMFNVVDVDTAAVDRTRVRGVPCIFADHQSILLGRDAFAWVASKKAAVVRSAGYGNSWDSMTAPFAFLDDQSSPAAMMTNSGMSTVYTKLDACARGGDDRAVTDCKTAPPQSERAVAVNGALDRLVAERKSEFAPVARMG